MSLRNHQLNMKYERIRKFINQQNIQGFFLLIRPVMWLNYHTSCCNDAISLSIPADETPQALNNHTACIALKGTGNHIHTDTGYHFLHVSIFLLSTLKSSKLFFFIQINSQKKGHSHFWYTCSVTNVRTSNFYNLQKVSK